MHQPPDFISERMEGRRGPGFSWSTEPRHWLMNASKRTLSTNSNQRKQTGPGDCLAIFSFWRAQQPLERRKFESFLWRRPSRTNLHLLALRSFHPNQEICSRVKCLPVCLPAPLAPRLSRETEQARKGRREKGGGPRKFLVLVRLPFPLSLSDISAFLRHAISSTRLFSSLGSIQTRFLLRKNPLSPLKSLFPHSYQPL